MISRHRGPDARPEQAKQSTSLNGARPVPIVNTRSRISARLEALGRTVQTHRTPTALVLYVAVAVVAHLGAWLLRFELSVPDEWRQAMGLTLPFVVLIRVAGAWAFHLTTQRWRFVGVQDVVRLWVATTLGTLIFWAAVASVPWLHVPLSIYPLDWILTVMLTAGIWLLYRLAFEHFHAQAGWAGHASKRALVVGAGEAGNQLAREIRRANTQYRLIGFVDDVEPVGTTMQGYPVLGGTRDIAAIVEAARVQEIIIAIPSASPALLREIVSRCEVTELPIKVVPGLSQVLAGHSSIGQLRDLRIEDLLGREPIALELPELERDVQGKAILITGAAGSIGSELARQIAANGPAKLLLLDRAETPLFFIELELRETYPDLVIIPIVADVVDSATVVSHFRRHRPQRVFHAAALKHVPLMEKNIRAAFRDNVQGTLQMASMAGTWGAERFVLISTDKAVRPRNVMGATKRLAELTMLAVQERYPWTHFTAVRFGNVLGSQGSVVPVFRHQMATTRVLTVTHPDVTRYFMTIPEAVQLVLQASLLPDGRGRIAMLDMGEPVRILDLARNLLRLSGLREGFDARIVFTGLRPGEKLHEELVGEAETSAATNVARVQLVRTPCLRGADILERVARVAEGNAMGEAELREFLFASVGEIVPPSKTDWAGTDSDAKRGRSSPGLRVS